MYLEFFFFSPSIMKVQIVMNATVCLQLSVSQDLIVSQVHCPSVWVKGGITEVDAVSSCISAAEVIHTRFPFWNTYFPGVKNLMASSGDISSI